MNHIWRYILFVFFCFCVGMAWGQKAVVFTGSVQHDGLFPTDGADHQRASWAKIDHLSNTYADFGLRYMHEQENKLGFTGVNATVRAELTEWPMPGYDVDKDHDFKGHGISHVNLETQFKWGSIEVGDVYGQFGSGMILRLYEERSLGIDNSLRGAKVTLHPVKGLNVVALGGKQRVFWNCYDKGNAWNWNYKNGAVLGADAELHVDQWSKAMQDKEVGLTIGGSWVSKYEPDEELLTPDAQYRYNLPLWVGAGDARVKLRVKNWDVQVEYARKANDPSLMNEQSYAPGEALMASVSYSRSGLSVLGQVKRSENMYFRSERSMARLNPIYLNHLPAFTNTHTYALASLNTYATQMDGEWAFQGEIRYTAKRKTAFGGKYGTTLKLNASHVRGLHDGWWQMGETYYTDINIELNKKLSKAWYLNAMLMYQNYNKQKVEEPTAEPAVRSYIGVVDAKVKVSSKVTMRGEVQYLYSKQDAGQWVYGLYELSLFNKLMLSVADQYCIGHGTDTKEQGEHYYMANVTYQEGAHRLSVGYGRTREGYNCSGGVCRKVPEQKGVMMSYNFTF